MCALQLATEAVGHHIQKEKENRHADPVSEQVEYLKMLIDDHLTTESAPKED
jgi:hypothetical protein